MVLAHYSSVTSLMKLRSEWHRPSFTWHLMSASSNSCMLCAQVCSLLQLLLLWKTTTAFIIRPTVALLQDQLLCPHYRDDNRPGHVLLWLDGCLISHMPAYKKATKMVTSRMHKKYTEVNEQVIKKMKRKRDILEYNALLISISS